MSVHDDHTPDLTPVQYVASDQIWLKRDDLYCLAGVSGGKVRACWALCSKRPRVGLVTASHRPSPQGHIVSSIAKRLGIPCHVHTPLGEYTDQMILASREGAEITQHQCGYNNVIIKRAIDDAELLGWLHVPFGMECREAVQSVSEQVRNIPSDAKRIVVPVGSGISLSGILQGLRRYKIDLPVLGVMSGADSRERLNRYAPANWNQVVTLVASGVDYHKKIAAQVGDVTLDPTYEAKAVRFLEPRDVLWCVGVKRTLPAEVVEQFNNARA